MTIALLSIYALIALAGYVLSPIIDPVIEGADAFGVSKISLKKLFISHFDIFIIFSSLIVKTL